MNPLLVLKARAEARAYLFQCGGIEDSGDAVAPLLIYADESGLLEEVGAEGVVAIIHKAFESKVE